MVWRIRDRATFEALRRTGRRSRRGPVTVTFAAVGEETRPRVAYAVGRRVGGAVVRNRLRRRLRAVAADIGGTLRPGAYLVAAGREATGLPYEDLKAHVTAAMTSASQDRRP
ncbi:MAG TPA: ribonuclease P protein component [Acidimicrobiales bacterium]|nr:ribonuclease P protein component [Acidimicrobiales bacterium]